MTFLLSVLIALPLVMPMTEPALQGSDIFAANPTTRSFTATVHYVYTTRQYTPPVPISYSTEPSATSTPEATLITNLSALHRNDFAAWLETWDLRSRETLLLRRQESGQAVEQWLATLSASNLTGKCSLTRWISRKPYVILRYGCTEQQIADAPVSEQSMAFKKESDRWFATLDLEQDPIFKNATGRDVELSVRPRD